VYQFCFYELVNGEWNFVLRIEFDYDYTSDNDGDFRVNGEIVSEKEYKAAVSNLLGSLYVRDEIRHEDLTWSYHVVPNR